MYSEPCARLTMSMMPNTSVRPAASKNSIRPNCRPFSSCSSMSIESIAKACSAAHPALLRVGVAVLFHHGTDELVGHLPLFIPDDLAQVVILDREVIGVERERTTHRGKVGLLQGLAQRILVLEIAVYLLDGGVDQLGRVIAAR